MPLGQAPYGSRTPSQPDEPGDDDRRPREGSARRPPAFRWLFLISFVALLAYFAAMATRGVSKSREGGVAGPAECLTDRSCAEGWRCYAVPKDDPFAVSGVCTQQCEGDLQCPAHFRCESVAATKDRQVVPIGARGATETKVGVCRACEGDC